MKQVSPPEMEHRNGASVNGSNGVNGNSHHVPPPLMIPMATPPASEGDGGLDMSAIWNAFRRRWFLALSLGLLLGVPAAIGMWMVAPSPYVAFAELRLNSINTQTFPGAKAGPVPDFQIWKQAVLKRASHPKTLTVALRTPEVQSAKTIRDQEPHAASWLEERLAVKSVGTEYVRIELEGEYPQELANILKAVTEAIVEDVDSDLYKERTNRKKSLDKLIAEVSNSIAKKTADLENMRNALKIDPAEIDRRRSYLLELTSSLRSSLVQIEVERLKLQGQQPPQPLENQEPKEQIDRILEKITDGDPRSQRAAEEVASQKRQIETQEKFIQRQSESLSDNHPSRVVAEQKLVKYKTELDDLVKKEETVRQEIKEELKASLPEGAAQAGIDPEDYLKRHQKVFEAAFAENEKKLRAEIEEVKLESQELDRYSFQGAQITREIGRERTRLERFQDELERLRFEIENTPKLIEISRPAEVPHLRSLKKKTMLSGVAGFGVFGFFVAGIVFLEYRTQRIATINQVTEQLNLRVMGTVPLLPRSAASGNTVKKKAKNALWYSALTEAVDSTRTLLVRGSQFESLKTVMVASAVGGEGKTTMASHLATSLARGGRKILLMDCDLRRPCMHRAFDLPMSQGVCEILRGEADIADCIHHLDSPAGLSVLPAGKINQQVLKLLAMDSLGEMLEPLKTEYDFIIIDSSPLLPVTDALLVAQHVDGVILSIRRDVSRIGKVVMACQKLSMLGIPLLGAVTIGLQEEGGYHAKYGYNYYSYGHRQQYYTQPPPV